MASIKGLQLAQFHLMGSVKGQKRAQFHLMGNAKGLQLARFRLMGNAKGLNRAQFHLIGNHPFQVIQLWILLQCLNHQLFSEIFGSAPQREI